MIDALVHYYEHDNANVHRGIHELSNRATTRFEAARARAAKFINAKIADEIIFTRGTTEGINLVASSWGAKNLKAGDVILLTEMEHHSNLVPWQLLAQRTGAKIAYVPITGDEGLLDLSKLDSLLTKQVKIFSMVHISNSLGTVNPVAELCARARKLGIVTLVDGAQSAGHLPVDVQAIGCDFFAFSGHKICGPTGIGVLWGRQEILDAMPPYQGGGEMILTVGLRQDRIQARAAPVRGRHAGHFRPDRPARRDGLSRRHRPRKHLEARPGTGELRLRKTFRAERHPALRPEIKFRNRAGLVSFLLKDVHAHDVVTLADQAGVALRGGHHCTQPLMHKLGVESTARASFYFYNTKAEVDRFVEVVKEIQKFFGIHMTARRNQFNPTNPPMNATCWKFFPARSGRCSAGITSAGAAVAGSARTKRWRRSARATAISTVAEVLAHIQSSHEQDAKVLISPTELAELLQQDQSVKLVDVRSREEFEAVHIAGSVLLSQDGDAGIDGERFQHESDCGH